jgi:rfaE bifunctional protein nucleotidyltransferase chain/domain
MGIQGPDGNVIPDPAAPAKVVTLVELLPELGERRARGERVAFTNGAFDLLHVGHVRSLARARGFAELLVVGLNSDVSVRAYKSPERPILPQAERAELLAALACVDYVVVYDELTAERLVEAIRPDVYVKGGDYTPATLPEAPIVHAYGGRIELVPLEAGRSTTGLVREIVERFGPASDE